MRSDFRLFSRTVVVGALSLSLTLVTLALTSAVGAAGSNASQVSRSATPVTPLSGVKVLGWGFNEPGAITLGGTHLWVVNVRGNSVTELSASTGALVKFNNGSGYGFDDPEAITSDGTHVWVANMYGNSVTELSETTGALVKVISGSSYWFRDPCAITSDGTHVCVFADFPVHSAAPSRIVLPCGSQRAEQSSR